MIKSQVIIEFGKGTVGVFSGKDEEANQGILALQTIEKADIGTKIENEDDYFPVVMTFEKIESIDIVIKHLEKTKKLMLEK